MDYVWIAFTAVGLIGSTRNSQKSLGEIHAADKKEVARIRLELLKIVIGTGDSTWPCNRFVRDEFSPLDFDKVVYEHKLACEWQKRIRDMVESADTINLAPLPILPELKTTIGMLKDYTARVRESVAEFNKEALLYNKYENQKKKGQTDIMFALLSPLLLIMGLAIRIAKVTGELQHEKQ